MHCALYVFYEANKVDYYSGYSLHHRYCHTNMQCTSVTSQAIDESAVLHVDLSTHSVTCVYSSE